jgi:hypothetical protein
MTISSGTVTLAWNSDATHYYPAGTMVLDTVGTITSCGSTAPITSHFSGVRGTALISQPDPVELLSQIAPTM